MRSVVEIIISAHRTIINNIFNISLSKYFDNSSSSSSSSSSSRDGLIGPLPAKCRPEAFDAHSFTTFRERGKTG